jgi:hypothetical protein
MKLGNKRTVQVELQKALRQVAVGSLYLVIMR